ncbi:HNH endonuclease, partial [Ramlibacter sp. AN1015]|uniref:HNH endonuclease n=1 Tax=Ramlibacter sp. AN1015 TaxID=3133428 RepID=UPI0030C5508F
KAYLLASRGPSERARYSRSMPNLVGYPAGLLPIPPKVQAFIDLIEEHGFTVRTTDQVATDDGSRQTLVVRWRGNRVGYMKHDMWRDGPLMGFHFHTGMRGKGSRDGDACPEGFSQEAFARERGVAPESLQVRPNGGHNYLRVLDAQAALNLLQHSASVLDAAGVLSREDEEDYEELEPDQRHAELEEDLADLKARKLPATTERRLTDARLGQGGYRRQLEKIFVKKCAVRDLEIRHALRASHILPWRASTDEQRLDPYNGLLLSATLDALFDKYLITFDQRGQVRVSRRVSDADRKTLQEIGPLRRPPLEKQWVYLEQHNREFDRREAAGRK